LPPPPPPPPPPLPSLPAPCLILQPLSDAAPEPAPAFAADAECDPPACAAKLKLRTRGDAPTIWPLHRRTTPESPTAATAAHALRLTAEAEDCERATAVPPRIAELVTVARTATHMLGLVATAHSKTAATMETRGQGRGRAEVATDVLLLRLCFCPFDRQREGPFKKHRRAQSSKIICAALRPAPGSPCCGLGLGGSSVGVLGFLGLSFHSFGVSGPFFPFFLGFRNQGKKKRPPNPAGRSAQRGI